MKFFFTAIRPIVQNIRAEKINNEDGEKIALHFEYLHSKILSDSMKDQPNHFSEEEKLCPVRVELNEHQRAELKAKIDKLKGQIFDSLKD